VKPSTWALWVAWFPLLVVPLCAAGAGAVTWLRQRDASPGDGELPREFLRAMAVLLVLSYLVVGMARVQEVLDPSIKVRRLLQATPVLAAFKQRPNQEWQARLDAQVTQGIRRGLTTEQIAADLRPDYLPLARETMPFARAPAVLAHAQALLPLLKELQAQQQAQQCVQVAWPRAGLRRFDGVGKLAPQAVVAWEQSVAGLVQGRGGMGKDDRVPQDQLRAVQAAVLREMQPRWGDTLPRLTTARIGALDSTRACGATVELLELVVAQPPPLAASLAIEYFAR
jgi:hypothetical protein